MLEVSSEGDGPVDACYKAIEKIVKMNVKVIDYSIQSVTSGKDAVGEVNLKLEVRGQEIQGRGTSTDVIEASVKAYLFALNKMCAQLGKVNRAPV